MAAAEASPRDVLVTGASGFVGSHVAEALVRRGHRVTCLVRPTSDTSWLRALPVRFAQGDVGDPAALREAVRGMRQVYHVAGLVKARDRAAYLRANHLGTRHLLEALADVNPGLDRFVHMSSLAAAGPSRDGRPLTEKDEPRPVSWYGESKLMAEQEVLRFAQAYPVTILRPAAVYGPRDRETALLFRMVRRGWLLVPGGAPKRFSLAHARDVAEAFALAGERPLPSGEIFFIARPEAYTWEEVGRAVAGALGTRPRQLVLPAWLAGLAGLAGDLTTRLTGRPATLNSQKVREMLQAAWLCDSTKARERLGFTPAVDLEEGIRETARWYREHRWL
ncbi:MAG: NAD-dependent epimerase/dehydratase family protein [Deltaproteobacteria bacterium]|nr:NAD-dependent epimerase/dehydratase family protein [Deltaproteobacteria bacterium]